ncbi:MAG: hypothetical protein HYR63_03350, partial [Proteobacteria bacterium]|nr:hypothetical protein [Pseudomonadota bacterium]
ITKTLAICMVCGNPADRTQRITNQHELVVVGAPRYDEAAAKEAWQRALDWFNKYLRV